MEAYPARLEDKPVDFMADLGREAAFKKLKNRKKGNTASVKKTNKCQEGHTWNDIDLLCQLQLESFYNT